MDELREGGVEEQGGDGVGGEAEAGGVGVSRSELEKRARMGEALERIERKLFEMGLHGLQRLSRSSVSELEALRQAAHNAALVTVERQLEALATQAERYLERDPLFTLSAWTSGINRLWVLVKAVRRRWEAGELPSQLIDLVGELRRTYVEVDEALVVQVLAANGWVTDTGFVGVTVYYAVRGQPGRILQASNARPTMYFGEDPRELMNMWFSDNLPFSVSDISHGAFELRRARMSADERLSFHKELSIKEAAWLGASIYAPFAVESWRGIIDRIRASEVQPLEGAERCLVYVEPASWGPLQIDHIRSRATATLRDGEGAAMTLEVPLRKENNFLIDALESMLNPRKVFPIPDALVGQATIHEGRLKLFPYSALYEQPRELDGRRRKPVNVVHLTLEMVREGNQLIKEDRRA